MAWNGNGDFMRKNFFRMKILEVFHKIKFTIKYILCAINSLKLPLKLLNKKNQKKITKAYVLYKLKLIQFNLGFEPIFITLQATLNF